MTFYFDSFFDFIMMGGHYSFVWSCYGITLFALVTQYIFVKRSISQSKKQLNKFYKRTEYRQKNN